LIIWKKNLFNLHSKEYHGIGAKTYPKIKTLVVKGKEDLSIRITDFGGGMSYRQVSQVWKYMYSTAPRPSISSDVYSTQSSAPLVLLNLLLLLN